ncbi:MAG: hypothetical protein AB1651_18615 [Pseudomonadota bacterium]
MATNVAIVFTGRDLNTKSLVRGLKRDFADLKDSGERLNRTLGAIGAGLSAAGIVAYGRSLTGTLATLDDVAEMTGETVENLSILNAEARISGTEFNQVAQFANRLAKGLSDADDETKGAGKALAALGIDARGANGELKNTPQLMREIAQALQRFQEGPGKQAILQALGGRGGAELIPFFNDLARTSELTARATAEQAAAAEATERAFRRLKLEADTTATALLSDALPAIEGMARGLGDVVAAGRQLEGESKIARWAEQAAIAAAVLIDALGALPRMARAISGSFEVVYRDVQLLDRAAQIFFKPLSAEARGEFETALEERNRTLAEANERYADLWSYNGRAVEEAVRRNIEAVRRANQAVADLRENADPRDLRLMRRERLEFSTDDDKAKKINDGKQLIEQLVRESQELRNISAEERVLEDLRSGRYRLTQLEKERVGVLLEQNVALRAQRAEIEAAAKADLARLHAQQEADLASEAEFERIKAQVLDFTGQTDAARKRRQAEVLEFLIETGQVSQQEAERAVKAIAGIGNELDKTRSIAEELGLTFQSAFEDAIVSGEGFRGLLQAIGRDIARIFLRKAITEPAGAFLVDLFKSGLPAFDAGTPYVPRDMLAVVHRGEAIIPARENSGGRRAGAPVVNIVQNFRFGDDVPSGSRARELAAAIERRTMLGVYEAQRRGGALAVA